MGIVQRDGRVAFARDRLEIDSDFVKAAAAGNRPETRFRFASTCSTACSNWQQNRCRIADALPAAYPPAQSSPQCAIRPRCRWYRQIGETACRHCEFVVTDLEYITSTTNEEEKLNVQCESV